MVLRTWCKKFNFTWLIWLFFLAACTTTPQFESVYTRISEAQLPPGAQIPSPRQPTLVTITGKVRATNGAQQIVMDLPTLEAVGLVEYDVLDPFENRKIVYRGVLMRDLLDLWQVAADATTARFVALNDYAIDIPLAELRQYPVLFALQADGAYMQPDYRGPAMLIYPIDDYQLDPIATMRKLIWQIELIDIQ